MKDKLITNVQSEQVAPPDAKPLLPAVLSVGSKVYRTNYSQITDVITIERVTKTQAIAKNGTYKFDVNVSSNGYVRKIGQTDRWSSAGFYLETDELKQQLWKQQAITILKNTDFSKLSDETLRELLSVLNGR
jgi:hypothetical protein